MMATLAVSEGSDAVPDFVAAVIRNAEYVADLTGTFLDATGLCPKSADGTRSCGLSAASLLELGAILQLGVWERNGFRPFLPDDLPSYREAATNFARRAEVRQRTGRTSGTGELRKKLFFTWLRQLAWHGQEILQAEVLVGEIDEDSLVDAMADFLWNHRHNAQRN